MIATVDYVRPTPGLVEFAPRVKSGVGYVATDGGHVLAFTASDGTTRWNVSIGGIAADTPAVAHGRVFVQSRGAGSTGFVALSHATGAVMWRHTGFTGESSPTAYGQRVCGASSAGVVGCYRQAGGATIWEHADGCKVTAKVVHAGHSLYVSDYCGWVSRLNEAGSVVWRARVGGAIYAHVAVAGGLVIVDGRDCGCTVALSASSGARVWRTVVGAGLYASPATDGDAVYTASRSGRLVKLALNTGRVRWSARVTASMGSPVVTGGLVWFSTMQLGSYTRGHVLAFTREGMHPAVNIADGRFAPCAQIDNNHVIVDGMTHLYKLTLEAAS